MKHSPQSLADMLERDYFPPNSSLGKNLFLAYDEWRMVIEALRAHRAEVAAPKRWDIYATEMWGSACLDVEERPDGMWVRWDDIASQYMNPSRKEGT